MESQDADYFNVSLEYNLNMENQYNIKLQYPVKPDINSMQIPHRIPQEYEQTAEVSVILKNESSINLKLKAKKYSQAEVLVCSKDGTPFIKISKDIDPAYLPEDHLMRDESRVVSQRYEKPDKNKRFCKGFNENLDL